MKVACIGAGVAGLSAAIGLAEGGSEVTLFDKGRGAGGRLSTRRTATALGEVRFDHGAQFFTARSQSFASAVQRLEADGAVAAWTPRRVHIEVGAEDMGVQRPPAEADQWYVGTPGMNGLVKALAKGLDVNWSMRAVAIEREGQDSFIVFEDGERRGPFDTIISAVPAEQAAILLEDASPALAREAKGARTAPCWAVMLAFSRPLDVDWDAAMLQGSPIGLAARNSGKPGREGPDAWVLHATPDWSRDNVDAEAEEVAAVLANAFSEISGAPAPASMAAHRWLYAKTETAAGSSFGWDADRRIATIGDWRIAPRVEAAWQSGLAIADFLLN